MACCGKDEVLKKHIFISFISSKKIQIKFHLGDLFIKKYLTQSYFSLYNFDPKVGHEKLSMSGFLKNMLKNGNGIGLNSKYKLTALYILTKKDPKF